MRNLSDEELFRFLDDDCPPDMKREIEDVLDGNPDAKARLDQIRAMEESAIQLGLQTVSSNFTEQVLSRLKHQTRGRRVFDSGPLRFSLILLGLVLVTVIIGIETAGQTIQSPYLPDIQVIDPMISAIVTVGSSEYFKTIAIIVMGLLSLFLLDIFILKPLFISHQKKLLA